MYRRRYTPSKAAKKEFAKKMSEIDEFCDEHNIHASASKDSYYFDINGQYYRVSNHSIEASNAHAFNWLGERIRDEYHPSERNKEIRYIHAGKTRIIEIYNNLLLGKELDGRGNVKY